MAYIESSLMMFRGESHKLLSAAIPDESGVTTLRNYGMVCRDGEIIWEILGRKGRQIVLPISKYYNYYYHSSTVVIDIDKGSYVLQGSAGQYGSEGFIVSDSGIMLPNTNNQWNNVSTNGAVFYSPVRKLSGPIVARFGIENNFYGVGLNELKNNLVRLTVDKHGMAENEEVVDEIDGLSRYTPSIKYKGCDFCILQINDTHYRFNLKTHELTQISSSIITDATSNLRWLTDGKFVYLRTNNGSIYLVVTSDLVNDDKVIYAGESGEYTYTTKVYCRYPYVYIWRNSRATSSSPFILRIIKVNVVTGESQTIYPDSIKIGDVTIYTKASDENGSPQAPYFRLYGGNFDPLLWDYNEYFDDGILKDDLAGGYGVARISADTYYAIYMDNLELRPSEHNMTVFISNF